MTAADTTELVITRIFDAPRELVFECLTTPEHLTHFWGPTGVSAPPDRIVVDARPGGAFTTVMVNDADGSEYPTSSVFTVASPWVSCATIDRRVRSASAANITSRSSSPIVVVIGGPRPIGPGDGRGLGRFRA